MNMRRWILQGFIMAVVGGSTATVWAIQQTDPPPKSDKSEPQQSPEDSNTQSTTPPKNPTPEAILRDLQRNRPTNTPVRSETSRNPKLLSEDPDDSGSHPLLREGEFLNERTGRLERDSEWWTIVFETDSNAAPQPPMRILPNQKLENMTRAHEASSESIIFQVSGEVTLFAAQNYLLIRKSLRQRGGGNLKK